MSYRYGPRAIAVAPCQSAETLYVVGGLYGNLQALDSIVALAGAETGSVKLCFNGDFNWFNVDDNSFLNINRAVLAHDVVLGNVEAELLTPDNQAGCGCAYPEGVDEGIVVRSDRIHARLKATALKHPDIIEAMRLLPMLRRYCVGDVAVGVVHGDADSLAGWGFDAAALDAKDNRAWIVESFRQAQVDVFASSHTCLPAMRSYLVDARSRLVINNGAAGMPNFSGERCGLITRIGRGPSVHRSLYGERLGSVHVDAIAVEYDYAGWQERFRLNWPAGSEASASYLDRIQNGPEYDIASACKR